MNVRLTGTRADCERFAAELTACTAPGIIRAVSGFHPRREESTVGRLYLDLQLPAPTGNPR